MRLPLQLRFLFLNVYYPLPRYCHFITRCHNFYITLVKIHFFQNSNGLQIAAALFAFIWAKITYPDYRSLIYLPHQICHFFIERCVAIFRHDGLNLCNSRNFFYCLCMPCYCRKRRKLSGSLVHWHSWMTFGNVMWQMNNIIVI